MTQPSDPPLQAPSEEERKPSNEAMNKAEEVKQMAEMAKSPHLQESKRSKPQPAGMKQIEIDDDKPDKKASIKKPPQTNRAPPEPTQRTCNCSIF